MKSKLTLSVDEKIIKKAKSVARKKSISVSRLFEEQIQQLSKIESGKAFDASKMVGLFGKVPANFDWKKERTNHLIKKHG